MNNKAQFTPGPWVVTEHSSGMICVAGPDHKDLCAVGYNKTEGRDDAANATLIAAAPAMYEALQFVREFYQTHFDVMPVAFQTVDNICTTALSQAEGR